MVSSTQKNKGHPASNVLICGEEDATVNSKRNYWLAEKNKTEGQGFTMKVDNCSRMIAGFRIKNKGKGGDKDWATKEFRVSGSLEEEGPWQNLTKAVMNDTRGKPAPLLNFFFDEPQLLQFLKFDLISFWGDQGGGLQYFAPILAAGKHKHDNIQRTFSQIPILIKRSQM